MQQYLVIATDGDDEDALARRMSARPSHFEGARYLKANGNFITGGAILDDAGKMTGSMMLVQFASEKELNNWLNNEPYLTQGVWRKIDIRPFKVADV